MKKIILFSIPLLAVACSDIAGNYEEEFGEEFATERPSSSSMPFSSAISQPGLSSVAPVSSSSIQSPASSSQAAPSSSSWAPSSSTTGIESSSQVIPSSSSIVVSSSSKAVEKCGNVEYNPSTQFCILDVVYERCGNEALDTSAYFCQNGKTVPLCGGKSYNTSTRFCGSDNTIHELCGGKESYDVTERFCYEGTVYKRCRGETYNPEKYTCSNSTLKPLCGSATYDSTTHFCGSDNIAHPLCDGKSYDVTIKFCYGGSLHYLCGGRDFNPNEYACSGSSLLPLCGTDTYNPSTDFCSGTTIEPLCGGKSYDVEGEFCYEREVYPKCNGETYNPNLKLCVSGSLRDLCGTTTYVPSESTSCEEGILFNLFTDARDGKKYRYVSIDTFTVMADNLNYSDSVKTPNIEGRSYCYNENSDTCEVFGRLYTWTAAMDLANSYVVEKYEASGKHQGICPAGWHIPSLSEWDAVYDYATKRNKTDPYNDLKAKAYWKTAGTNLYGLSVLPSGWYSVSMGRYGGLKEGSVFWTTDEFNGGYAMFFKITNGGKITDQDTKWQGSSVRCFKD